MNHIYPHERKTRSKLRPDAIQTEGHRWLARQGKAHGFVPIRRQTQVTRYRQDRIERGRERQHISYATTDIHGALTVTDPEAFAAQVVNGFESARAFGCGLMLLQRQSERQAANGTRT